MLVCIQGRGESGSAGSRIFYYLPPAGREIIKRIPCVCACVIECVSRFYKGLYITLVVSPWPFQCFCDLIAYVLSFDAVISHLGP